MSKSKDEREAYTKHLMSLGWQPATTMSADDKYQYAIALGILAAAERDALQARIDRVRPWLSNDLVEILDGEYDGLPHTLDAAAKAER